MLRFATFSSVLIEKARIACNYLDEMLAHENSAMELGANWKLIEIYEYVYLVLVCDLNSSYLVDEKADHVGVAQGTWRKFQTNRNMCIYVFSFYAISIARIR